MSNKTAQERSLLNKLRERTNISGKILEGLNDEFAELMTRLRSTDEKIRAHAEQTKDLTRAAKSLLNRRDYLSSAANISAFHERCRYISAELEKFIRSVDLKHYKFLLDQFDDEQKEQLFGYDPTKDLSLDSATAAFVSLSIIKQAGLSDWWFSMTDPLADVAHNLTTGRGQAMRALEKRFSISFLKSLKTNSSIMVSKTERLLQLLLAIFKKLGTALAKRNVDQYVENAKLFIRKFAEYHTVFVKYYNTNIVPLKEQHNQLMEAARQAEADKAKEDVARKIKEDEDKPQLPVNYTETSLTDNQQKQPNESKPKAEKPEELLYEDVSKLPQPEAKKAHIEFFDRIEKFASVDDKSGMLNAILAYSEELETSSPEASMKLLAIAEGISDDAGWLGVLPHNEAPAKKELDHPLDLTPPSRRQMPVKLDLPEGRVDKKYSSIPALASITADQIRITPPAADHIAKLFIRRLYDLDLADTMYNLDDNFEAHVINELRNAVVRGIVITNSQSSDTHNPIDRQLEIYSYVNLNSIDKSMKGIAKLKIACRFSLHTKTLSIRTIQRNFNIEK